MSFAKLDSGIINSTLWVQPHDVLRVWIWFLSQADANGVVRTAAPALAHACMVPLDRTREILVLLESPDPDSRSNNDDGRRLRKLDGGWQIINYGAYRAGDGDGVNSMLNMDGYVYYIGEPSSERVKIGFSKNPWSRLTDLRVTNPDLELLAVEKGTGHDEKRRHAEFAELRQKGEWFRIGPDLYQHIESLGRPGKQKHWATGKTTVATVATSKLRVATQASTKEAEAEVDIEAEEQKLSAHPSAARFDDFWAVYPKKVGKKPALAKWKTRKLDAVADRLIHDVMTRASSDDGWLRGYVPDPCTYLNQDRWEDDLRTAPVARAGPAAQPGKQMQGLMALEEMKRGLVRNRNPDGSAEAGVLLLGKDAGR
jgi:hypothetical protein